MKTFKYLRILRIAVALAVFCLISAQFVDVYHSLGRGYYRMNPTALMYAPALLKILGGAALAAGWAFIVFTAMAFIFGRAYCSFICPFGILMDILRRICLYPAKSRFLKNSRLGKFCKKNFAALKYSPPIPFVRWIFLALATASIAFGYGALFGFIEPYSLYGKIMGALVHPAASAAVDGSGRILAQFGVYSVSPVGGDPTVALSAFGLGILILAAVWLASALAGRIYCNTICPVGALLGLISKVALCKLSIDKSSCVSCGMCERNCKAKCADSKGKEIDFSRCVLCFDCAANCPKNSIGFKFAWGKKSKASAPAKKCVTAESSNCKPVSKAAMPRRSFGAALMSLGAIFCAAAKKDAQAGKNCAKCANPDASPYSLDPSDPRSRMPSPPGSGSVENFLEKCTGCQICTAACKAHILKPSLTQWGLSGIMRPYMDYSEGFCLHACHSCTKACPTGAIKFLTSQQKKFEKIGTAIFKKSLCVVKTDGTDCAACAEHCPVQAIEMLPFGDPKKSLYIPHVHAEVCIGCGACEYICPVRPKKAIVVQGLAVHKRAVVFKDSMRIYKPEEQKPKTEAPAAKTDSANPFPF